MAFKVELYAVLCVGDMEVPQIFARRDSEQHSLEVIRSRAR